VDGLALDEVVVLGLAELVLDLVDGQLFLEVEQLVDELHAQAGDVVEEIGVGSVLLVDHVGQGEELLLGLEQRLLRAGETDLALPRSLVMRKGMKARSNRSESKPYSRSGSISSMMWSTWRGSMMLRPSTSQCTGSLTSSTHQLWSSPSRTMHHFKLGRAFRHKDVAEFAARNGPVEGLSNLETQKVGKSFTHRRGPGISPAGWVRRLK